MDCPARPDSFQNPFPGTGPTDLLGEAGMPAEESNTLLVKTTGLPKINRAQPKSAESCNIFIMRQLKKNLLICDEIAFSLAGRQLKTCEDDIIINSTFYNFL